MSTPIKTRAEFQQLAISRLEEAKILLDAGKWDGAYYLTGYAIEIALKACIIKLLMATDAFPEKRFSERCYTHDLEELLILAGLNDILIQALSGDPTLRGFWEEAIEWSEQTRYHRVTDIEAKTLYTAVADRSHGVLSWIILHW